MTDATTNKPLHVSTDGTAGPYLMVPDLQLDGVIDLLRTNGIRCWADENVISLNGAPAIGVINLGRDGDAKRVQAILDKAP
jgi:hypothetical protein